MARLMVLFVLLVSNMASAANGSSGWVSIEDKPIQIISNSVDARAFIYNVVINDGGCTTTIPVLKLDSSQTLAKEMYSTLLTAKTTGKKVKLITKGCWNNGEYPAVFSIYLE